MPIAPFALDDTGHATHIPAHHSHHLTERPLSDLQRIAPHHGVHEAHGLFHHRGVFSFTELSLLTLRSLRQSSTSGGSSP